MEPAWPAVLARQLRGQAPPGFRLLGQSLTRMSLALTPQHARQRCPADQPRGGPEVWTSSSGPAATLSFCLTLGRIMLAQDRFTRGRQMRCPKCMAENAESRRFCAQCGAPLPSPCPACDFANEPAARFCGGCGRPIGERAVPEPERAPPSPREDSGERRQLTVMFCDLVGSTQLSAR